MEIQGPFFSLAKAAEYCGYKSPEHFADLLRGYAVPKYGPKKNRYARSVLDAFMADPKSLKRGAPARRYVPKKVMA
ncbi:hypothetical protein [Desulfovibrio sp. TomC]|uniref:hypothetical protein n=1 Tax=Desulfovibrio sp. TomC TaxID=1562888 RepID=UPI000574ACB6|nr:hypothetical protein [Desulfovibrio sp. TomC]KHK02363.1 hypothetical protein NY78_2121 [Desulfovibrio sp. TomC]